VANSALFVADDSQFQRKLVERALADEEYGVARNGREAMTLMSIHEPAVVVTDGEMPDLTGLELCSRGDNHAYTYIILLTSNEIED